MQLSYIVAKRTNGANPFKIFEALNTVNQEVLASTIRALDYSVFLKTAYWFGVSTVAKSRAGMRCQICNSRDGLTVHHRTYDAHGKEHLNMMDLVVLCVNCHGLFHGHLPQQIPAPPQTRIRVRGPRLRGPVLPEVDMMHMVPDGDPIILTRELIRICRTARNGFTNATIMALGLRGHLIGGWPGKLVGTPLPRAQYLAALKGRYSYGTKRE